MTSVSFFKTTTWERCFSRNTWDANTFSSHCSSEEGKEGHRKWRGQWRSSQFVFHPAYSWCFLQACLLLLLTAALIPLFPPSLSLCLSPIHHQKWEASAGSLFLFKPSLTIALVPFICVVLHFLTSSSPIPFWTPFSSLLILPMPLSRSSSGY